MFTKLLRLTLVEKEMTAMARRAFEVLACRDFARVDFRVDANGVPYFIEINPLPGLMPKLSDIVIEANADGISHTELINMILNTALARYGMM